MPILEPSITTWNRLEPQPRGGSVKASLRAEVRDPLWFLARQWQFGEYQGEDAASAAFVDISWRTNQLRSWGAGATSATLDPGQPLERQALAEPFSLDTATSVELGHTFFAILDRLNLAPPARDLKPIKQAFLVKATLAALTDQPTNPLD